MISTALALLKTDEQRNVLSEFYQKYKNRFYAIAYSKLHGKTAAEDAVQEAFLRIVDKPEKFFKIEHNKRVAYADVIVRNVAIDMFNKNNAHKIEEGKNIEELTEDVSDEAYTLGLEDTVIGSVSKNELLAFILKLPVLQRDILNLKVVCELSNSEIAQKLNVSETVVRQRLFQARKSILDFLESGDIHE